MIDTASELIDQAGTGSLSGRDRYRLLATKRRRVLLDVLADRPTPVDLGALASAVADREASAKGTAAESAEKIAVTLHHIHLPLVDELGILDYDPETNRVESVRVPSGLPT